MYVAIPAEEEERLTTKSLDVYKRHAVNEESEAQIAALAKEMK